MSGTDGLADFLAARYDEAEALAKAAQIRFPGPWEQADNTDSPLMGAVTLYDSRDESVGVIRGSYAAAFIADVDPAHRLADIKLKRAILADAVRVLGAFRLAECTVRQLGTEFDGHAGYKPEWAPAER